jgi:hypothetical protein
MRKRLATLVAAAVTLTSTVLFVPTGPAAAAPANLAQGRTFTASSSNAAYTAANAGDGDPATYWESANGAWPHWIQVDLGAASAVTSVVLRLPAGWETRTQTIAVQDGATGGTIAGATGYTFNPGSGNTVTVPLTATVRHLRLSITGNTAWPAGQLSTVEVWGEQSGAPQDPNLALGATITGSSTIHSFVAANANDGNTATYWESAAGAYPATLTVSLGANASLTSVVVKLNPDAAWGARTQNIEVLGRAQNATGFTTLAGAANRAFDPGSGNTVTIPVTATVAEVQLRVTSNTGASGAQVAELQVFGTAAPNPDLTVTGLTFAPSAPVETDPVTASAVVRNAGTAAAAASTVRFYVGTTLAGTATVGALAAGASVTVTASLGARPAGTHQVTARVDEANAIVELNEQNNTLAGTLTVSAVPSSDLVAVTSWSPSNPAPGSTVTFTVAIRNQGTIASASGAHPITVTLLNQSGAVVRTLSGAVNGTIAAGGTTAPVSLGTWAAANGRYTVRVVLADDANEVAVKRANNTAETPLFVGRGANMPYEMYEAEDGATGGGAAVVGPNRTVGDLAGEASGRRAVTLNSTGSYVQWTTRASTNTLVTRFSIPDAPGGGGTTSTLNVYVNNTFLKAVTLTSRYAWLYGDEAGPNNSPSSGAPRHIYDEANVLLGTTVPAGSTIKLQKDAANGGTFAIDFVNLEQVTAAANPDPARYAVPSGFTHQAVQDALDRARQDANLIGVYLPSGDYQTASKFQVYGKPVRIVGAGPWFTRFQAPAGQDNTDIGFRSEAGANGSVFAGFGYFGNYTSRIDGPGKVFDFANVANQTIDNIWVEHMICLYWGANTDNMVIKNSRIRNTFADGVNMTNGSTGNLVSNNDARATGDDSFALFSAIDAGGADEKDNVFENLTSTLTWRAAGLAVYGGYANTFRNIYIADTLVYSGITISSLDFGYPMNGFGADPPTRFENISIVRAGGHFWGQQTFPAIWVFSASKVFQGIRVSDVDIVDPTYSGIMFQTQYLGGRPVNPITDTVFTNVSITGAQKSGDAFDAKSGFAIWANELPEPNQGPAVGAVTFNNLRLANNHQDIRNTTPLRITVNP